MSIQLHKEQRSQIRLNGDLSESFSIANCAKQCCILAPTLFIILRSDVQATKWWPNWRGCDVCQIRSGWQPLQSTAPPGQHQDPVEADQGPFHRERCCSNRSHGTSLAAHNACFADALRMIGHEVNLMKEWGSSPAYRRRGTPTTQHTTGNIELKST